MVQDIAVSSGALDGMGCLESAGKKLEGFNGTDGSGQKMEEGLRESQASGECQIPATEGIAVSSLGVTAKGSCDLQPGSRSWREKEKRKKFKNQGVVERVLSKESKMVAVYFQICHLLIV